MIADRIRECVYISPSGVEFRLKFNEVDRSGGKKTAVHELPQQDRSIIQDLGTTTERYPLNAYFVGQQADKSADSLWVALSERGVSRLKHPRYGDFKVVPLTWTQAEKLVDGLGQVDFKIEFLKIPPSAAPLVTTIVESDIVTEATTAAVKATIQETEIDIAKVTATDLAVTKGGAKDLLAGYKKFFSSLQNLSDAARTAASTVMQTISSTIDELVEAPLSLYGSLAKLIMLPATLVTPILGKIEGYRSQIETMTRRIPDTYYAAETRLMALYYSFAGIALSPLNGTIDTRDEAITLLDAMADIRSAIYTGIEAVEATKLAYSDSSALDMIETAYAHSIGIVLNQLFNLKTRKEIIYERARTPLDIIPDISQSNAVDEVLDDLIKVNKLEGLSLLLMAPGPVVYYE